MRVENLRKAEPRAISGSPVRLREHKEHRAFRDNLEHLEALEYVARLKLAIAYLRRGKASKHNPEEERRVSNRTDEKQALMESDFGFGDLTSGRVGLKELESALERAEEEVKLRTRTTLKAGVELHFETLCSSYCLDEAERSIVALLFANYTGKGFRGLYDQCELDRRNLSDGSMSIGTALSIIHPDYRSQVASRIYFSVDARLIRNEIVIPCGFNDNAISIFDTLMDLHERIISYILGDNSIYRTDLHCISKVKSPVQLDQVVLPGNLKGEILDLAKNYSNSESRQKKLVIDEFYGYGTGLTFLFYGPSGTGKTMLANALADSLNKELLTVNIGKASKMNLSFEDLIKYLFKEAKLSNGIVFFDECDDVFQINSEESRILLIEIEKAECITILATNKIVVLDAALDRRITMKVPFHLPDEDQREMIWRALVPPNIVIGDDVDFKRLARKYIFTGGLIKNALFMAITSALNKNDDSGVTLTLEEIEQAADYQASSRLELNSLGKTCTPEVSIEQLPLRTQDKKALQGLASACQELYDREGALRLMLGSSDLQAGIDCANAVAKACELKVREFHLSDVLQVNGSPKRVKDPLTQKEVTALDYALRASIGFRSLTLLVDHGLVLKQALAGDQEHRDKELMEFLDKLRGVQDMVVVVTVPIKPEQIPPEFDHYLEINPPPEELQIQRWEAHFKHNGKTVERIVDLVERYPMHLHEIDRIFRQTRLNAVLNGGDKEITIEGVNKLIGRLKGKERVPVLFGNRG